MHLTPDLCSDISLGIDLLAKVPWGKQRCVSPKMMTHFLTSVLWAECSWGVALADHMMHQKQMHEVCKSTVNVCIEWRKNRESPASLPAATVTSLIGGNGLWWGDVPALLWEFNSITTRVKNELKLSLGPAPVFQKLSLLLGLTCTDFGVTQKHQSALQLSVCESAITHSLHHFVILICSAHPHTEPNETSYRWSTQQRAVWTFCCLFWTSHSLTKNESAVLPAWTSYLTEHKEDNTLRSTSQDHWPFHSTL